MPSSSRGRPHTGEGGTALRFVAGGDAATDVGTDCAHAGSGSKARAAGSDGNAGSTGPAAGCAAWAPAGSGSTAEGADSGHPRCALQGHPGMWLPRDPCVDNALSARKQPETMPLVVCPHCVPGARHQSNLHGPALWLLSARRLRPIGMAPLRRTGGTDCLELQPKHCYEPQLAYQDEPQKEEHLHVAMVTRMRTFTHTYIRPYM